MSSIYSNRKRSKIYGILKLFSQKHVNSKKNNPSICNHNFALFLLLGKYVYKCNNLEMCK